MVSLESLYWRLKQEYLKFLLTYKISQDHLELFSGKIRSYGGCNNNPAARQCSAAYKRLLFNSEIADVLRENCIPLEDIPMLSVSSRTQAVTKQLSLHYIKQLNSSNLQNRFEDSDMDGINFDLDVEFNIPGVFENNHFYYKNPVAYVAGFVVRKNLKLNYDVMNAVLLFMKNRTTLLCTPIWILLNWNQWVTSLTHQKMWLTFIYLLSSITKET